jgi:hypothetical protein
MFEWNSNSWISSKMLRVLFDEGGRGSGLLKEGEERRREGRGLARSSKRFSSK